MSNISDSSRRDNIIRQFEYLLHSLSGIRDETRINYFLDSIRNKYIDKFEFWVLRNQMKQNITFV